MKAVTAIGIPDLNKKIKDSKIYEIVGRDIIYQDGVFELLDIIKDVDILLISDILPGKYTFEELVKKIIEKYEKIEIIVFLDFFDNNKIAFLNTCGVYKIYELNNYKSFFETVGNKGIKDIESFKDELYRKIINSKKMTKKYTNYSEIIPQNNEIKEKTYKKLLKIDNSANIIILDGNPGSGKSILSFLIAKGISDKNYSVLQFSINKGFSSTDTFLGNSKKNNIYKYKKMDLYSFDTNKIRSCCYEESNYKYEELFNSYDRFRNEYDYIIVDMDNGKNQNIDISRITYEFSKMIIYICEPNMISIRKTKDFIEELPENYLKKVKVLINKANKNQVKDSLLKSIFEEYEILGKINYDENFDLLINKNFCKNVDIEGIKEIIEKITDK